MKILLINLTRFGDLLQTQPVISGFADKGHSVGLACLEHFAPATELLTDLDYVAPFPGSDFLRKLDSSWSLSLASLSQWRETVNRDFGPDVVINLTPTLSARMLTRFMALGAGMKNIVNDSAQIEDICVSEEERAAATDNCKQTRFDALRKVVGFNVDEFGFSVNSNGWATFLQSSSRKRGNSPCNLVDVFRKICKLGNIQPRYRLRAASPENKAQVLELMDAAVLQALGDIAKPAGYIGFQLGASDDRRRWPTGYFAQLGALFWQKFGFLPVLLGAKDELELGKKYTAKATTPFISLIGATDLPGLACVLAQTKMLVTNDTGTMHLAAGLNIPCLAIFLATAQPWDTGPYQEGMCCLEPDLPDHPRAFDDPCQPGCACRTVIEPDTVFELAEIRLNRGSWDNANELCGQGQARVWLTLRKDSQTDKEGFLDLKSLSGHEFSERTIWLRMQRFFLRKYLDNELDSIEQSEVWHDLSHGSTQLSSEFLMQVRTDLEQAAALLHLLAQQGQVLKVNPLPMLKNRFMGTWQRLQNLWDNSAYFNVLGLLWLAQTQEHGDDLQCVLDLAAKYEQLCKSWRSVLGG